jgi:hypothetical protein
MVVGKPRASKQSILLFLLLSLELFSGHYYYYIIIQPSQEPILKLLLPSQEPTTIINYSVKPIILLLLPSQSPKYIIVVTEPTANANFILPSLEPILLLSCQAQSQYCSFIILPNLLNHDYCCWACQKSLH